MQKLPKFAEEKTLAASLQTPAALESYEKILIGAEIRKLRKKKKWTQKELAALLKTSQSVVARLENGKQNLTMRTLINLAFVFGKKIRIQIG